MVERSWLILGGVIVVPPILVGIGYYTTRPPEVTPRTPTPTEIALPSITIYDRIVIGFTLPLFDTLSKEGRLALKGALVAVEWVSEVYGGVRIGG